ncbi:hypothetical protein ABIA39_009046 [Nocardia sp. GAS34]|uniref:ISAs1 family transposase n=1 Tax=unclassified Nocardia TaxID=2637762 RepID=UPI003D1F5349
MDADTLDGALCAWMWLRAKVIGGVRVISFDGKTLKGARDGAGHLTHLLAWVCQATGAVVAQVAVAGKTSEVPMLRTLLRSLGIAGCVITADAAHTCRETAQLIIDSGAHYVLVVKGNQPLLRARCKALPWRQIPVLDRAKGKPAHGRVESRVLQATEIETGIGFPGAVQVLRMNRTRTVVSRHRRTRKQSRETVYVVILWNLECQDHADSPRFTETIGSRVAVAGAPIWRGVAPVGVGTSTSRSRSWSSAA